MSSFGVYRIGKFAVVSICVFALGVALRIGLRADEARHAAFTAIALERANFSPDGTEALSVTSTQAVKSNGSSAVWWRTFQHETDTMASDYAEAKRIYDLGSRVEKLVFPLTESVSSVPISDKHLQHLQKVPRADCKPDGDSWTVDTQPEVRTILGYAVVQRSASTEGSGLKIDEWVAPRLGCLAMRTILRAVDPATGDYQVIKTVDVTSVTEGEPDLGLFSVPEKFTERSPWEETQESAKARGEVAATNVGIDRADQRYYSLRAGGGP
jgi:hypothetical protein